MTTEHGTFLRHDLGRDPGRSFLRPDNPYAHAFLDLSEAIGTMMESRTIRGWHYTRLTEAEVKAFRFTGIKLSTPATLRARLDDLVASGDLSLKLANALYSASPFHGDQLEARSGKFWMVSHPVSVSSSLVEPLMAHWGGEVASMWTKDPILLAPIATIGKPRVLEIAIPLARTCHSHSAGNAIVATFGRTLGCTPSKHAFDLYATVPLSGDAILEVHGEGDPIFDTVGRSYPKGYVDVDIGFWKELTGEDN